VTENLISKIIGKKYLQYLNSHPNVEYRIANRYKKIYKNAYEEKKERVEHFINNPERIERFISLRAAGQAYRKLKRRDEKFEETLFNFVKKNKIVSQRELQRRFSKKRIQSIGHVDPPEREGILLADKRRKKVFYVEKNELEQLVKKFSLVRPPIVDKS
jgi:hypothetical protein